MDLAIDDVLGMMDIPEYVRGIVGVVLGIGICKVMQTYLMFRYETHVKISFHFMPESWLLVILSLCSFCLSFAVQYMTGIEHYVLDLYIKDGVVQYFKISLFLLTMPVLEEIAFRVILSTPEKEVKHSYFTQCLVVNILFGLLHMSNLSTFSVSYVLLQVLLQI